MFLIFQLFPQRKNRKGETLRKGKTKTQIQVLCKNRCSHAVLKVGALICFFPFVRKILVVQAGAELGQAQAKLEVIVQIVVEVKD